MPPPAPDEGASRARRVARVAGAIVLGLIALAWLRWPIDVVPGEIGPAGSAVIDLAVFLAGLFWLRLSGAPAAMDPPVEGIRRPRRPDSATQGAEADETWEPEWDPYRVLGIRGDATPEEITRAFREKMKMYDPERVAGLEEDIQKLAHERVLEIRRAYDELMMPGARA